MDHVRVPPPLLSSAPSDVAPLPLRFNAPAGWPRPSIDWLAANQGWDPPHDWTPAPDLLPAPPGWDWWRRDRVGWKAATRDFRAEVRRAIIIATVIFAGGIGLSIAASTQHSGLSVVFWAAIVYGPLDVARKISSLVTCRQTFIAAIKTRAADVRQSLDSETYAAHVSRAGPDALPFDAFLAERSRAAWSSGGEWPADQLHSGAANRFRFPLRSRGRRFRMATIVLATLAGAVLVVIIVASLADADLGSGARPQDSGSHSASSLGPNSGSGPADLLQDPQGPPVDAAFLADGTRTEASCRASLCWVVRITATPGCRTAGVVVEFAATADGAPTRHQTFSVPLTRGLADIAPGARAEDEHYAHVADAWCSAEAPSV